MKNAKEELVNHIADRDVKHVCVVYEKNYDERTTIEGSLDEVLPHMDFEYDNGYGGQKIKGNIWYSDGTWSERGEYDGSEWWEHKVCPEIK